MNTAVVRAGMRSPGGAHSGQPMSFAAELSPEDSEKARAYVIHRVHETQKLEAAAATAAPATDVPVTSPK